jgi:glyoxylase I family protein
MNSFTKINHIALLISDLDKTRIFYGDILGLEEIERPVFRTQGIWYQLGECQLHLMLIPNMVLPQSHPENRTVQPHFAMSVLAAEYRAIVDKLILADLEVVEERAFRINTEVRQAFFYDPNGNMIEIIATEDNA